MLKCIPLDCACGADWRSGKAKDFGNKIIRVNSGTACGDTPYRETNVDTSYMRILDETSV